MLHRVVSRALAAGLLDQVIVATSNSPTDGPIRAMCADLSIPCFAGSEQDVLDRYYRAAEHFRADVVVRLTADCPLLDPKVIDRVIREFHSGECDYAAANRVQCSYPDGLDTEVFVHSALVDAWQHARLKSEREHVTSYILNNPQHFRIRIVKHHEDFSALRWTVDEPSDLSFVRTVYQLAGESLFGMDDVLELLLRYPELNQLNTGIERDAGYKKSLLEDGLFHEEPTP
jgi:spore coat polysaccharide biosynthesis protein SpsF (cytidylyltransferase family)